MRDIKPTKSKGLKSVDSALKLLKVLGDLSGPAPLRDLAKACDISASRAHRYLASLVHAGFAQTDGAGHYDLGKGASEIGLGALARHDMFNSINDLIPRLVKDTGLSASVAVWGADGPIVVRWQRAELKSYPSVAVGSILPLLGSVTGHVFLAFLPEQLTAALLATQSEAASSRISGKLSTNALQFGIGNLNEQTRNQGYAAAAGSVLVDTAAIAVPVFNTRSEVEVVVALVGTDPEMINEGSVAIEKLLVFARQHSLTPYS